MDVKVVAGATGDQVVFTLAASPQASPAKPAVAVAVVGPPFVADPSGLALQVPGDLFVRVRFEGMALFDAAGVGYYSGSTNIVEPGPGLRGVVRQSANEGVTAWILGYDAGGCATVSADASTITVTIAHR
jgi:hypothetical protein